MKTKPGRPRVPPRPSPISWRPETAEQAATFKALGGGRWLRQVLDGKSTLSKGQTMSKIRYELTDIVTDEVVEQSPVIDALVEQIVYQWSLASPDRIIKPVEVYLPEDRGSMDVQVLLKITEPWDGSQA